VNAASCYEHLASMFSEQEEYKLHWAQSLYQAGLYMNSIKVCGQISKPEIKIKVLKLEAAIRFSEENLTAAQKIISNCPAQDIDTLVNTGCILYKVHMEKITIYDGSVSKLI